MNRLIKNPYRSFSTSCMLLKPKVDPKRKAKRLQNIKLKNKEPPQNHPLYMDIPKALKYIRASEVGEQYTKSTITLAITAIGEPGSKPLSGFVDLPHPVKKSKLLIFTNHIDEVKASIALDPNDFTIGDQELIDEIKNGNHNLADYTHSFCSSEIVQSLNPVNRILSSKNLICHPRRGNVAEVKDMPQLITKGVGSVAFKQHEVHISFPIGRCDFSDLQILENIQAASKKIYSIEPAGTKKPNLIGQTVLSSTKGPGLVINFRQ